MVIILSTVLACDTAKIETDFTVTYYDDVQPIMAQHCTRCHSESGLGVGDFTDRQTVETLSEMMLASMNNGTMPPPASDPDCREYEGAEYVNVPQETQDTFARWIEGGKLVGTERSFPETVLSSEIDNPDVIVKMSEPYVPTYIREDEPGNEYRCFVLDSAELEGKYVTEVGSKVLSTKQMHHITLSFVDKEDVGAEYFDPQGWDCIDDGNSGFPSDQIFSGFAPGTAPMKLPDGAGFMFDPEKYIVMSMHYVWSPDADGEADQTEIQFNVQEQVENELYMFTLGVQEFEIPPNSIGHRDSQIIPASLTGPFTIYSVLPHMHQMGSHFDLFLNHSDGSETCGLRGDYSFDNQIGYLFREPIQVSETDMITLSCTWDNPTDQTVRYGERTDEEMCLFFAMVGP